MLYCSSVNTRSATSQQQRDSWQSSSKKPMFCCWSTIAGVNTGSQCVTVLWVHVHLWCQSHYSWMESIWMLRLSLHLPPVAFWSGCRSCCSETKQGCSIWVEEVDMYQYHCCVGSRCYHWADPETVCSSADCCVYTRENEFVIWSYWLCLCF